MTEFSNAICLFLRSSIILRALRVIPHCSIRQWAQSAQLATVFDTDVVNGAAQCSRDVSATQVKLAQGLN